MRKNHLSPLPTSDSPLPQFVPGGLFITFEGPEGAGKSTQQRLLEGRLVAAGVAHRLTREPGGTPLGLRVRDVVLDPELSVSPISEFLLYSASRAQLVSDVLRPALAAGEVVICDRYADSTRAYQGAGRGLEPGFLRDVTWEATGGLSPQLTFLLDVDPQVGLGRAAQVGRPDRLEQADLNFHRRVRQGFLNIAADEPERVLVLDAARSAAELHADIWAAVGATLRALGLALV